MTARRLLAPGGILLFATNRRGFRLDHGELGGLRVKDLSRSTLPFDCTRGANRHHVFRPRARADTGATRRSDRRGFFASRRPADLQPADRGRTQKCRPAGRGYTRGPMTDGPPTQPQIRLSTARGRAPYRLVALPHHGATHRGVGHRAGGWCAQRRIRCSGSRCGPSRTGATSSCGVGQTAPSPTSRPPAGTRARSCRSTAAACTPCTPSAAARRWSSGASSPTSGSTAWM